MYQMKSFVYLLLLLSVLAYEKIDIFSDNLSLIRVTRDDIKDRVVVESDSRIAISYETSVITDIVIPSELKEFQFTILNPDQLIGRYRLETPYEGVHIALTYEKRQPVIDLCNIFEQLLPCFNVIQCNSNSMPSALTLQVVENPVATIDLNDVFWTPKSIVPYSIQEPTAIRIHYISI